MSRERAYAALHLGDGSMSVLFARGDEVVEARHPTYAAMRDGSLSFVPPPERGAAGETVCRLYRAIDDAETIVGSTVVSSHDVLAGTLSAALDSVGARGGVDVLEIACPATWGPHRRRVLRAAAQRSAREVLMVDTVAAAVYSVGERVPPSAVVVDVARLESVVSAVTVDADGVVASTGTWAAVGTLDAVRSGLATRSVEERIALCTRHSRDPVDVFLVDVEGSGELTLLGESEHRIHRLDGGDIVRSMAARAGVPRAVDDIDVAESDPYSDVPLPMRSAAWLSEVTASEQDSRRTAGPLLAAACAVVVVALAAVVVFLVRDGTPSNPAGASSTPPMAAPSATTRPSATAATTTAATTPSTPEVPVARTFDLGRVRLELPSTWSARTEPDRLVLIPEDLPDRRILLTVVELRPGATFDAVADDLIAEASRRGDGSTLSSITRATEVDGRVALSYTESPDGDSVVVWRIFVESDLQIGIGCQSRPGEEDVLEEDCARAMSSVTVASG